MFCVVILKHDYFSHLLFSSSIDSMPNDIMIDVHEALEISLFNLHLISMGSRKYISYSTHQTNVQKLK